jgi:hypothetical protein
MVYCAKCGKEHKEDAEFCPHCGEPIKGIYIYRRPREKVWGLTRVLAGLFGALLLIVAFGLLIGGISLNAVTDNFSDENGFLLVGPTRLNVQSYAVVLEDVDIDFGSEIRNRILIQRLPNFVSIKLRGGSNNPDKEVFIGIAMLRDIRTYLLDVEYHRIIDTDWDHSLWNQQSDIIEYSLHSGEAPGGPPIAQSFWVAHVTGSGRQSLIWEPSSGDYWFVVMNADGSKNVDVDMEFGVKIPFLMDLGKILLMIGIFLGLIGFVIIYYGAIR